MKHSLVLVALLAACTAQGVLPPVIGGDTLYRGQVPKRSPTKKPVVENPADYDVYFDPNPTHGNRPAVAAPAPLLPSSPQYPYSEPQYPTAKPAPKYVPKPFVPRERKKVSKLQPAGPVLYSKPEPQGPYAAEPVQDLSKVPGYPGKDYPVYSVAPETGFSCDQATYRPGLYADVDAGCQAYHICEVDNRHGYAGATFLCTNGTVFNQYELTCDWWFNVDCASAKKHYDVNLDPYKNPYLPTPEEEAERKAAAAKYGSAPQPAKYAPPSPQYSYGPGFGPY